jgi:hypothetical protein
MSLTPGARLDLKRRLAGTLGSQDWPEIDLTLEEFGFPVRDEWQGSPESYVIDCLRQADDAALEQLSSYLHPTEVAEARPQPITFDDPTSPWSGTGLRLFISHVNANADAAGELRRELATRSVDAFVAHDSIEPTEDWKSVILGALRSCDACLALLTPGFSDSQWCDQEVGFCMARSRLVIPVEFGLMPYGFLGSYQALSVKRGQTGADIALAVFELLVRKVESRDAMAQALVDRWAATASWDAARENYGFLRKVPRDVWTQRLFDDVWNARDRVHDLRTASISWMDSAKALEVLFEKLPFARSTS